MAKKVEIDVIIDSADSVKKLNELRSALKKIPADSAEYKKVSAAIKDVEDKLDGAKAGAKSFKDQLEEAPGPIGALFQGMKKLELATTSVWTAFKAAGIGLLVSLVAGVAAAFSQTEEAGKKLQPLMIGFQKIFNGIFRALEPVFNMLVDLATKAMPFVTDAFGVAYSAMTSFLEGLGMLGRAIGKLIKGDFSGAWEDAKEAVTGFGDRYEEANKRFIAGTEEVTKTEKENLKERQEAAKKALEEKIKRMELEDKLDKAKMDKLKAEALALAKTEEEKLEIEKKFLNMANEARMKDIDDKQKLYKKDSEEYKNLQVEKIAAETEFINQSAALAQKDKQLKDAKAKEDLEKQKQKAEEERGLRALSIQTQIEDLDRLNAKQEMDFLDDLNRIKQKRDLLAQAEANELANTELTEFQKTEIRKKYADERIKLTEQEIETEKAAAQARTEVLLAYTDVVAQFGAFLAQSAGENVKKAKAGLLLEKAAGIASIIISTQKNAAAAGYLTPAGIAILASGAIGVATAINAASNGVKAIDAAAAKAAEEKAKNQPKPSLGRNYAVGGMINGPRHAQGGTLIEAEGGEAVMTRGAVTMFAPLLSAMNQMGGGTAFNLAGVNGIRPDAPITNNPSIQQAPPIIKTYVVSNELTSEAEKLARLKDLSTL